jgi:hypothetical protein
MSSLLRLLSKVPVLTETQLAWQRALLDRTYAKDISAARKNGDREKVESLESGHRFELELHDEEEDFFITRGLLAQARRLRVSIPRRYNEDGSESDHWYEGHNTGRWSLTVSGVSSLRDEIRRELKARHEVRSLWVVWLSAATGLVGAATGLVALLVQKVP